MRIYRRVIFKLLSMVLGTGYKPKVLVGSVSGKGLISTSVEPSQCTFPGWKRERQSLCPHPAEVCKDLPVAS